MSNAFVSQLVVQSPEFATNAAAMRRQVELLQGRLDEAKAGGGAAAVATQRARQKLLVRERLALLLDPQTPFLELSALAAYGRHPSPVPGAGVVSGIGRVAGRECMVVANDPTVKGGTYFPESIKKHLRAQAIARQNRLPCVYLVDSGGIFLPLQAQTFADQEHFGKIFANQAQMSAMGIAQIAVVLGMCTAGGAYVPAMADENIIVRGNGTIYLAGPPLVRAATGEEVSAQDLGGADMHAERSGVVDHVADDEAHALRLAREVVGRLGGCKRTTLAVTPPEAPLYPAEELYGLVPADPRQPYDVREILARLLDGSRFSPFKAAYGPNLVCAFGRLHGYPVGVLANNGVLFGACGQKGAHFVQLCEQRGVPLIFLQNITGFMVGRAEEEAGITKDGAKMVQAVATATVPKLTVMLGASHGAGNYAMCGRAFGPRFLFAWPNAKVSVMGAEQAAQVLLQLKEAQRQGAGAPPLTAAEQQAIRAPVLKQYASQSDATFASAQLWDDGIIDPAQTRQTLALALSACLNAPTRVEPAPGAPAAPVFRF